jgi:acyl carrier protein
MSNQKEAGEIEAWLINSISELLEIEPNKIDPTVTFESYGLDSSAAVILSGDLQEWLGCSLDPTIFFDYPTIEAVTQYLTIEREDI